MGWLQILKGLYTICDDLGVYFSAVRTQRCSPFTTARPIPNIGPSRLTDSNDLRSCEGESASVGRRIFDVRAEYRPTLSRRSVRLIQCADPGVVFVFYSSDWFFLELPAERWLALS
jgi:hypothetical protein